METEHHEQRVDFANGYVIAKRTDTTVYQESEITEYTDKGGVYRKQRLLYNIQYDYIRMQEWTADGMTADYIEGMHHYGHLQWEYGAYPPEGWTNPYPDNYEPVKPEGADIFHTEGISFSVYFGWVKALARVNMYIRDDLEEEHRKRMTNLITGVESASEWYIQTCQEDERERSKRPKFNPIEAAKKRKEAIQKHSKEIGATIPYDPLFMD